MDAGALRRSGAILADRRRPELLLRSVGATAAVEPRDDGLVTADALAFAPLPVEPPEPGRSVRQRQARQPVLPTRGARTGAARPQWAPQRQPSGATGPRAAPSRLRQRG